MISPVSALHLGSSLAAAYLECCRWDVMYASSLPPTAFVGGQEAPAAVVLTASQTDHPQVQC